MTGSSSRSAPGGIPAFWLLLAIGVWLGVFAGLRPLMPEEARYAGVAWDTLRAGSGFVPLMDGLPYVHKPPLFYWIAEVAFRLFGVNEWTARAPSWLAAWGAVVATYAFVRHYRGATVAAVAAIVLATQPFFFGGAQFANLDMLVAAFIGMSIMAGATAVLQAAAQRSWRRWIVAAAVAAALGVLAKGLIGIVLPGVVLVAWLLATRRRHAWKVLFWPPAIVVFAALAVPWFVAMQLRFPGFFDYFFVYQQFDRYVESDFANTQPFWFYLPVIAGLALPWSLWSGGLWHRAFWTDTATGRDLRWLMAVWVGVVVVFFSIPSNKLVGYAMPVLPAIAVLIAEVVVTAWRRTPADYVKRAGLASLIAAMLVCTVGVWLADTNAKNSAKPLATEIGPQMQAGDTLVTLHTYPYDLSLYAGLREPAWIVYDWDGPDIARRDNWRRELWDAGQFDTDAGEDVLVSFEETVTRMCSDPQRTFWFWGTLQDGESYRTLRGRSPQAIDGKKAVWRVVTDRAFKTAFCGEMPKAG